MFASTAHAATGAGPTGAEGFLVSIAPLVLIFVIFYFLLIRPQQKQKRDRERMIGAIKKGDRVVTTSGMHGTVLTLNENTVVLRVADQVKLEFDRSAVGRVVMEGQGDRNA